MKADSNSRTARIGVAGTQLIFEKLGWIFREQSIEDYGIDAHVEVVENNKATGKLIALQIKCGQSWFKKKNSDGFVFRGQLKHLEYWQKHSLPVIIVLYNDNDDIAYWQIVNQNNVKVAKKGWKLTIPFNHKIDSLSLEKIQEYSKKLTSINDYTILSLQDVSYTKAKRYSANILLSKESTKPDIIEIIKKITDELKFRDYYRNKQAKLYWKGQEAQAIWLFLYISLDDISHANWICRTQWISKKLPSEDRPFKLDGEYIDDEIVIDWNKNYEVMATFLNSNRLTKEDYIDTMSDLLINTKFRVEQAIKLTSKFTQKNLNESEYLNLMSQLEPEITTLYFKATNMDLAPTECSDLSQRFQSLMATVHNIVLPFSKEGIKTWETNHRNYLVDQAIENYQKELIRLEFELEKIQ